MPIPRLALLFALLIFTEKSNAQLKWDNLLMTTTAAPEDGKAYARFTFINAGDHPVKITRTSTTCGCTAAVAEKRLFAPGEKGEVLVSFNTTNRNGLYEEPITVKTDDASPVETVLKLRVLVKDVLDLAPTLVFWRAGEPLSPKTIHVNVTDGFGVKNIEVNSSDPNVEARIETVRSGSEYNIRVTPKTTQLKAQLTITPAGQSSDRKGFTALVRVK